MNTQQPGPTADNAVATRIWGSLVAAVVVYGLLAATLARDRTDAVAIDTLKPVLIVCAVLNASASVWWRRRATSSSHTTSTPHTSVPTPDGLHSHRVVVWALSETIAIYGLVLAFLARSLDEYLPFAVAALALLIFHRPGSWTQ